MNQLSLISPFKKKAASLYNDAAIKQ